MVFATARGLGAGPLAAFRIWFIAGYVLTCVAALWSFRELGLGPTGAAAGGFLFAFPLPMAIQVMHAEIV